MKIDQSELKEFKEQLARFVALRSISTDPAYQEEMLKTASWLRDTLAGAGFSVELLQGPTTNPLVFAEYVADRSLPTVLVYGHYDVQPAREEDGWSSEPFSLVERSGRLFGRGVVDNKGQIFIHIYTVLKLIHSRKLSCNVKFLIEGNEENSNLDLEGQLREFKDKFASDYVLLSDGEVAGERATIEASLRSSFNLTLSYQTARTDLHSGIYGGAVPSAPLELVKFLAKLVDQDNRCTIPGFYDGVEPLSEEQRRNTEELSAKELLESAQIAEEKCEPGHNFFSQTGLRPTLQITGLESGYIGSGYANIVPARASARINFRVAPGQRAEALYQRFVEFVQRETPSYVRLTLSEPELSDPVKLEVTSPSFTRVRAILEEVYGSRPVVKYVGGSIPFIAQVKEIFGIDTMSVSLGNDDCNMHGADENFRVDLVEKGLSFSRLFFSTRF